MTTWQRRRLSHSGWHGLSRNRRDVILPEAVTELGLRCGAHTFRSCSLMHFSAKTYLTFFSALFFWLNNKAAVLYIYTSKM
uniref:Uncharacterized protein n=1 Tax=Astyanax mexicanus TaxID=7994 RepID=A0A3B1J9W8_ASTMX